MSAKPMHPRNPPPVTRGVLIVSGIVLLVVIATLLVLDNNRGLAMPVAASLLAGLIVARWFRLDEIAAYVFIAIAKPFRIGDRIGLPAPDVEGEVAEIGLMRTKLVPINKDGVADTASGRVIRAPNSFLLRQAISRTDARHAEPFLMAEIAVQVAYDSDWETAEKALLNAARQVTEDVIKATGREPVVDAEGGAMGLLMRVRCLVPEAQRLRTRTEILKRALAEMQSSGKVYFAGLTASAPAREAAGPAQPAAEQPTDVDLGKIDDTGDSVDFRPADPHYIQELADRIRQMGLLQPIVVQRTESGRYSLVAGRFRFLACKQLGWQKIPAVVREPEAKKNV